MGQFNTKNGFIYALLRWSMEKTQYLNLIEYFKLAGSRLSKQTEPNAKRHLYISNAVDFYTILKWLLILSLWYFKVNAGWIHWLVWYMIITNLHTFIFYFLWKPSTNIDHDRSKKRFLKLILAIFFSDLCFAYMYNIFYFQEFTWDQKFWFPEQSIWFSISNSVAGNYDKVKPLTEFSNTISMIQYMITFLFVGVIISKATPDNKP